MPKITGRLGTGMTERGVVRFETEDPADIHGLIAAGIHALDRSSFDRLSRRLADLARRILSDAGLPSDPEATYPVTTDGTWEPLTAQFVIDEGVSLPLPAAVQGRGYPPDSAEGYAARLLMIFSDTRQHQRAGNLDGAMALAFAAGELVNEAGMKEMFENDFLLGEDVRGGGRKGHERRYGTEEEKAARRAAYLQAFDAERAAGKKRGDAALGVAKRFGVSDTTIRRAVRARRKRARDSGQSSH